MNVGKGKEASANRNQLWPCWHCPKAYHTNCIPPNCKYHEYLLLCPDHCHLDLPHLPGWDGDDDEETMGEEARVGHPAIADMSVSSRSNAFSTETE